MLKSDKLNSPFPANCKICLKVIESQLFKRISFLGLLSANPPNNMDAKYGTLEESMNLFVYMLILSDNVKVMSFYRFQY